MRLLHYPVCPFCRKVRLQLEEKALPFTLEHVEPWRRDAEFLEFNHAGEVPVLEDDGTIIADSAVIADYLEDAYPERPLLGATRLERNEILRLVAWFDAKFNREVMDALWRQKLVFRLKRAGTPGSDTVRAGYANLRNHLDYIGYLAASRNWIAGETLSLADLAAAAHLSVLDYLGDVPWDANAEAKEWYARVKSRPSFRALLRDRIPQQAPAAGYDDLDF